MQDALDWISTSCNITRIRTKIYLEMQVLISSCLSRFEVIYKGLA